jgi:hypothetical protein
MVWLQSDVRTVLQPRLTGLSGKVVKTTIAVAAAESQATGLQARHRKSRSKQGRDVMSKPNGNAFAVLSRTGLALTSLIALAATALPVERASAQAVLVKFDGKKLELKKKRSGTGGEIATGGTTTIKSVRTKAPRDEEGSGTKIQQIVVGKSDRDDNAAGSSGGGVTRQVIVEPKPKKIVVTEPKAKKKIVVAKAEEPQAVIAEAAPAVETPVVTTEVQAETPVAEAVETPAEPQSKFEVGQIVTTADGISYVIVKIDDSGVSALPLSAFLEEPAQPVYKPVYKKKKYKKRYSSYRSYGGYSGCH